MKLSKSNYFLTQRFLPGQDLKKELAKLCFENKIKAGCLVSVVGSLSRINIRLANSHQFLKLDEKFEVLALQGLVSLEGLHLHLTVANSQGQVYGGHLMEENIIFTTFEMVLLVMEDIVFHRELDPATGYKELK